VQVTVGTALVAFQLARKPKVVVAFGASTLFQVSLVTVTLDPDWVSRPPQSWVITCPLANVHRTVQPVVEVLPVLRTVTEPWKPPLQLLVIV
jgi:hypothetical protein